VDLFSEVEMGRHRVLEEVHEEVAHEDQHRGPH
jgi:hypothetical protein